MVNLNQKKNKIKKKHRGRNMFTKDNSVPFPEITSFSVLHLKPIYEKILPLTVKYYKIMNTSWQ